MRPVICGALVALLSALLVCPVFAASSEIGVVLMHGKWGSPKGMVPLARELESRQYRVSNAEMPWSGRRLYDVDYPAALKEIEAQVRRLRANGAKRAWSWRDKAWARTRPLRMLHQVSTSMVW